MKKTVYSIHCMLLRTCCFNPPSPTHLRDYFPHSRNPSDRPNLTQPGFQGSRTFLLDCRAQEWSSVSCSFSAALPPSLCGTTLTPMPRNPSLKEPPGSIPWGHRFRVELRLLPTFDLEENTSLLGLNFLIYPRAGTFEEVEVPTVQ